MMRMLCMLQMLWMLCPPPLPMLRILVCVLRIRGIILEAILRILGVTMGS